MGVVTYSPWWSIVKQTRSLSFRLNARNETALARLIANRSEADAQLQKKQLLDQKCNCADYFIGRELTNSSVTKKP